jgi:hypothetical protein
MRCAAWRVAMFGRVFAMAGVEATLRRMTKISFMKSPRPANSLSGAVFMSKVFFSR